MRSNLKVSSSFSPISVAYGTEGGEKNVHCMSQQMSEDNFETTYEVVIQFC
jgi:hypothetical protein